MKKIILLVMLLFCVGIAYARPLPYGVSTSCDDYIFLENVSTNYAAMNGQADTCGRGTYQFSVNDWKAHEGYLYIPSGGGQLFSNAQVAEAVGSVFTLEYNVIVDQDPFPYFFLALYHNGVGQDATTWFQPVSHQFRYGNVDVGQENVLCSNCWGIGDNWTVKMIFDSVNNEMNVSFQNYSNTPITGSVAYTTDIDGDSDIRANMQGSSGAFNITYIAVYNGTSLPQDPTQWPPVITFSYPLDAIVYNDYNGTLTYTTDEVSTCDINDSNWVLNNSETQKFTYYNSGYSSLTEGNHSINVTCSDGSSNEGSSILTFSIDTLLPEIESNLQLNDTNWSLSLLLEFNATDPNLQSVLINDSCGGGYYNGSVDGSPFQFSQSFNITSCTLGTKQTNITACDNTSNCYNTTYLWDTLGTIRFRAYTKSDQTAINSFSIYKNEVLDGSTTSGTYDLSGLIAADYEIKIDADGYAFSYTNITLATGLQEYNFSLYKQNTFTFIFREEETKNIVENVSLELISNLFSNNYTTQNGTMDINLLIPQFYTIRYESIGYGERFYYYDLTNRSYNNITLYLIDGINVTATVLDGSNNALEDAYIKVLRYSIDDNAYTLREVAKTNFEGEAELHLKLNTEFYYFIIEYPFGTVKKTTSPTYIYESALTFQITLGTAAGANFFNSQGVSYALTFNNDTNNMRFTYSDSGSIVTQGCLDIYLNTLQGSSLYNTSCVTNPAASILLGITNTSGKTYEAKAFVYLGSTKYYLTSLSHTFAESRFAGNLGMLLIIFLTVAFAFIGAWSLSVALILTPLPLFFGIIMNLIDYSIQIAIGLEIVCIIVAIVISRKNA